MAKYCWHGGADEMHTTAQENGEKNAQGMWPGCRLDSGLDVRTRSKGQSHGCVLGIIGLGVTSAAWCTLEYGTVCVCSVVVGSGFFFFGLDTFT